MDAHMPVSGLPGVGAKRAELLNDLHIRSIQDLVLYYPRDYDDRSDIKKLDSLIPGYIFTIRVIIQKSAVNLLKNGRIITSQLVEDETGRLDIIWYNQPYMRKLFNRGDECIFTGKITEYLGKLQMESPEYEVVSEKELINSARIVPIYPAVRLLSQKVLRKLIKNVIDSGLSFINEFLPKTIMDKYELCPRRFAIENIHFPLDRDSFFSARRRLVFDELFLMQLALFQLRGYCKNKQGYFMNSTCTEELLKHMAFALTPAQQRVLDEIKADMKSGYVMNRIIQGDVGSGKTAVAMAAAYITAVNGGQTAIMAPTEVLARQHYESFDYYFRMVGVETVLLTGSITASERKSVYEQIKSGTAKMVVGTHALIQKKVEFAKLELVITDEQHRFGVNQRLSLSDKAANPHVLVMSATPIPRTLGLVLYGDMDISIIDELPPGRQKIDTFAVDSSYNQRLYTFIKKELIKGHQAYIICPAIDESSTDGMKSVKETTKKIKDVFEGYRVECLYGKMKPDEKQAVMEDFSAGLIQIIVSTTVIEVGVNVPNATIMVIENAERFGLSQLHQLRGRVGRGADKSFCILISDTKVKTALERLSTMKKTNDGFMISEMDLQLRGPGDFFGTRQHGLPEFRLANLYKDMDILKTAQQAAVELSEGNIVVSADENKQLENQLENILHNITDGNNMLGL